MISNEDIVSDVTCIAKNRISQEEPYFASFYYNNFYNVLKQILVISFEAVGIKFIGIHLQKRKKSVSMKNKENTGDSKQVAKYGHLTKYMFESSFIIVSLSL